MTLREKARNEKGIGFARVKMRSFEVENLKNELS